MENKGKSVPREIPRLDPLRHLSIEVVERGAAGTYIFIYRVYKRRWLRPFGGCKTIERRILDHYANVASDSEMTFPRLWWKVGGKVGREFNRKI